MGPLALLILALALQPAPPPVARLDDALEIDGEGIGARLAATRMTVPVTVNGAGPFRFVVDSGADRSVIGRRLARRLALAPGRPVTMQTMVGPERVETVAIDRLGLGTGVARDIAAPALDERHLGADGLIGIDALADQRLMLDFKGNRIVVQDATRPAPPASGDEIVVTARRRGGQLIITEVRVRGTPVFAIIDTGSQVTIGNTALRRRLGLRRGAKAEPVTLIGVTGRTIEAEWMTLPELRLGRLTLGDVGVAFADVPPFALFGVGDRPALLLGTDLLSSFARVSLDFRRRKVRFQLRD